MQMLRVGWDYHAYKIQVFLKATIYMKEILHNKDYIFNLSGNLQYKFLLWMYFIAFMLENWKFWFYDIDC